MQIIVITRLENQKSSNLVYHGWSTNISDIFVTLLHTMNIHIEPMV